MSGGTVVACVIGVLLLFPGICSLINVIKYPNDVIAQAFATLFLLLGVAFALIAVVLIYRAFGPHDS